MPRAEITIRVATRSAGNVASGVGLGAVDPLGAGVWVGGAAVGGSVTIVGLSDGSGPASTGAEYVSRPIVRNATPSAVRTAGTRRVRRRVAIESTTSG